MADPQQKLVKVDDSIVAFPQSMPDEHIAIAIKNFRAKKKPTTEASEHERQLKPAQPLSSAIPELPDWANTPLLTGNYDETPEAQAKTAKSQAAFSAAHPTVAAALKKGDNPYVLGSLEGADQFVRGLSTPANLGLMVTAPESKLLSAYFAIQAGRGAYKDAGEAAKAYKEGRNQDAARYLTQAVLGAGTAAVAGTHASYDAIRSPIVQSLADSLKTDIKTLAKGGRESEHGFVENPFAPKQPKTTEERPLLDTVAMHTQTMQALRSRLSGSTPEQITALRDAVEETGRRAAANGDTKTATNAAHSDVALSKLLQEVIQHTEKAGVRKAPAPIEPGWLQKMLPYALAAVPKASGQPAAQVAKLVGVAKLAELKKEVEARKPAPPPVAPQAALAPPQPSPVAPAPVVPQAAPIQPQATQATSQIVKPAKAQGTGVEMERTAEGKVKMGADAADLARSLGSSLYQGNVSQVITKELLQNAMDAVREVSGDKNVTIELFSGSYPPKPRGEVIEQPVQGTQLSNWVVKLPDGSYFMDPNASPSQPRPKKWQYHWDAEQELNKLFPKTDEGDRVIKLTDTGKGMTKEELETVFTDLGRSGKRNQENASGGFGLAKAAPFMMSEHLDVSTVTNENGKLMRHSFSFTPDEILSGNVDIKSEELPHGSAQTGTTITSHLPKKSELYGAQSFINQAKLSLRPPGQLRAFHNGKDILGEGAKPIQSAPIATAEVPGAILDLYTSHDKSENPMGKWAQVSTEIHNNGIYQFSQHASLKDAEGLRGLPTRIAVDVKATVPEGHPDYPFTANREALRGDKINGAINKLVKDKITQAAIDAHKQIISAMYWQYPMLMGYMPLFDSGSRLLPEELNELMENKALKEISDTIMDITAAARQMLVNAAGSNYALGEIGERTKRVGIVLSDKVHGVHITNPEDKSHATVFINPFDKEDNSPDEYASLMWHTIQHELVHDEVSGHNESFTTGFKNVSRALGSMNIKALTELRNKYADPSDPTRVRPDFDRAFQIYRLSRARAESTPDILGGEESRSELDRPGGKEDRGASLRDSGEGVVPIEPSANLTYKAADEDQPFYLKSERAIAAMGNNPMSKQGAMNFLIKHGVGKEEMYWTGLEDLLSGPGQITADEIRKHQEENAIEVKEVGKGGEDLTPQEEERLTDLESLYIEPGTAEEEELTALLNKRGESTKWSRPSLLTPGGINQRELLITLPRLGESKDSLPWKQTPDGIEAEYDGNTYKVSKEGDHYVTTSPGRFSIESPTIGQAIRDAEHQSHFKKSDTRYNSSHWDEKNPVVHVRFNDRIIKTYTPEDIERIEGKIQETMPSVKPSSWGSGAPIQAMRKGLITPVEAAQYADAKGFNNDTTGATKKVAYIEEIQSDWHQQGADEGYAPEDWENKKKQANLLYSKKYEELQELQGDHTNARLRMSIHQQNGTLNTPEAAHDLETMESLNERVKEAMRAEEEAQRQYNAIADTGKQGVLDAPFKGAPAWSELMVKRMVRWAVKHGYDGIALTPGEIQDERNDLSKTISQVRLFPAGDEQYRLTAYDEDTHVVLDDTYTRDALPGVIGKEATEKLLAMEPDRFGVRTLVGLDLKTGGKFHYQLYDTIIPNILNKIGKRFGSKVEGIKLNRAGKLTPQEEAIVQESNRIEEEIRAAKKEVEKARIETLHTELTEQEVNEGARRKLLENEVDAMNRFDKLVIARNEWMHKNYKVITKHQQLQADKDLEKNAHFLPITPEMRKGVTEQGFPLFNLVYKAPPAFEPTLAESYRKQGDAWAEMQRIGFRPPSDPSKVAEWERRLAAARERFNAAKATVEDAEKGIGEVHDLQNGARVLFLRRAGLSALHIGFGGEVRPGSNLNGVSLTKDQLVDILGNLNHLKPAFAKELKQALLQAMDDKDGSVTVSTPREPGMSRREWLSILYEELFHTSERNYPLSNEQWMQLNAAIPDAFNDHLAYNYEMGDDGTLKRAKMRAKEAIAHFAAGRPEEYGMSQEEMASYLFQYYDALVKTHGPEALEKLKGLAIEARRVREEYKNATGIGRLQRDNRDNRSLSEGGQAGTSGTGEEAGRGVPQESTSGPRGDREGGSTEAPKPAVEPQASLKAPEPPSAELNNAIEKANSSYASMSPYEISHGHCYEWAKEVAKNLPGAQVKDVDLWPQRGKDNLPYHVWVEYQGKAYDAETTNGVSDWKQLPFFKEHSNQEILSKLKPRVMPSTAPTPPPARQESPQPLSNLTFSLTPSGASEAEKALTQPGDKTLAEIYKQGRIKPSLNALRNEAHLRNPKNIIVRDDSGMLHVFKDQQSATAFKMAAGIHEHNGK